MSERAADVLQSPAVGVLVALEAEGFSITPEGNRLRVRPISKLTPELRELLERYRDELLVLLRICDDGVQERRTAFVDQLNTGVGPGLLVFRQGVAYVAGRCFCCGDGTARPVHGVCWRCAIARRLALRVGIPADLLMVYDAQKVVA